MIPGDSPAQVPIPGPAVPYMELFEIPLTPIEVRTRIVTALIEKGIDPDLWGIYTKRAIEIIFSENDKHSGRE